MSASEFLDWQVYYQLEPFGELRADLRSGTIAATIANIHRDRKKRKKPYSARDFMPGYELTAQPKQALSADGLLQKVAMINEALGGKDERHRESDR